jgi:hypothetical protein
MSQTRIHQGSGIGGKMAGGNPHADRGREDDDYYPTPPAVTRALVIEYPWLKGKTVWEPCAGDGKMAATLLDAGIGQVCCTELNPRPPVRPDLKIGRGDVFHYTVLPGVDAVITNPPFMLAPTMIPHILGLEGGPPQFLALVLKATFWHAARRHKLFKKHPPTGIHPLLWRPDFLNKGAPTMEIMWCVWDQAEAGSEAIYVPLPHPGG